MVAEARRIISMLKIPDDMRPPKSIWHSSKKCEQWVKNHKPGAKDQGKSGMIDIEDWERE
jgi:hypothetical protein